MIEQIKNCKKCKLCQNQLPLLDQCRECEVFWVGLSAKRTKHEQDTPLSPDTNTGKVLSAIEEKCEGIRFYKTNLVKCLPLTDNEKIRYPNVEEMDCCFDNLTEEFREMSPKLVFLLGDRVSCSIEKNMGVKLERWDGLEYSPTRLGEISFVSIHHPSYIYVYKKRYMGQYIDAIQRIIGETMGSVNE